MSTDSDAHQKVEARISTSTVEMFLKGRRIVTHTRSFVPAKHTTLGEALSHLNKATDDRPLFGTRTCELYHHSLNKLWNAHARHEGEPSRADTSAFAKPLQGLPLEGAAFLLERVPLRRLSEFTPESSTIPLLEIRLDKPGVRA